MRPHESLHQEMTFTSEFFSIKMATPPCFPTARDQKLGPAQWEEESLIDFSHKSNVSCTKQRPKLKPGSRIKFSLRELKPRKLIEESLKTHVGAELSGQLSLLLAGSEG